MNRLPIDPRLPDPGIPGFRPFYLRLYDLFREFARFGNATAMWDTSGTTAPTTGTWAQGDKCENTAPSEAGSAGSKYVVIGWVCVTSGSPGTWKEMRTLTGN